MTRGARGRRRLQLPHEREHVARRRAIEAARQALATRVEDRKRNDND